MEGGGGRTRTLSSGGGGGGGGEICLGDGQAATVPSAGEEPSYATD
jgi:hypothetical protein